MMEGPVSWCSKSFSLVEYFKWMWHFDGEIGSRCPISDRNSPDKAFVACGDTLGQASAEAKALFELLSRMRPVNVGWISVVSLSSPAMTSPWLTIVYAYNFLAEMKVYSTDPCSVGYLQSQFPLYS